MDPGESPPRRGLGAIHPGVSDHGGTPTLGIYLSWLKASHFVYLRWAKMALKWPKWANFDNGMTRLTHPRVFGSTSDVLAG